MNKALPAMMTAAIRKNFTPFKYRDIEHVGVTRGTKLRGDLQDAGAILENIAYPVVAMLRTV
jgi:hypothetical protein